MSKRITKKFNSKFYGIDFYGYEHINKVSEKEPINCELRGQITKEIVKKLAEEYQTIKPLSWKECKDIIDNLDQP